MTRKLASIRRIKELLPITGADRIELAIVDGWQVVVKKAEFKVGELAVYFEIDSFIPNHIAPFLTSEGKEPKEYNGVKGERLKTVKLRKQLSQGLLLPVEAMFGGQGRANFSEGDDVTEALGIQKWEAPEEKAESTSQQAKKTRAFPYFLRKTDQERIQNYGHMVVKALEEEFEVTVKKDGSSITIFRVVPGSPYYEDAKHMVYGKTSLWQRIKRVLSRKKDEPVYGICSRNTLLPLDGNSNFHKAAAGVLDALKDHADCVVNRSLAIQGEVVAPDIQGNYEQVEGVELHIFDIFEIDKQEYMLAPVRRVWVQEFGLKHVKVVDKGTLRNILQLQEGDDVVKKCLTYASGPGDNPGVDREGVVFKAAYRDFSFKAVSNEYLLKTGK